MKLTHSQNQIASKLYQNHGTPLDKLPYTTMFERMLTVFAKETGLTLSLRDFYVILINLRKAGKLGKTRKTRE